MQLTRFVNYAGLEPMGKNLYRETSASGTPTITTPDTDGAGRISQGSLEAANVNVVEEMVEHDRNPACVRDQLEGYLVARLNAPIP